MSIIFCLQCDKDSENLIQAPHPARTKLSSICYNKANEKQKPPIWFSEGVRQ